MSASSVLNMLDKAIQKRIAELDRKMGAGLATWESYQQHVGRRTELEKEVRTLIDSIRKQVTGEDDDG